MQLNQPLNWLLHEGNLNAWALFKTGGDVGRRSIQVDRLVSLMRFFGGTKKKNNSQKNKVRAGSKTALYEFSDYSNPILEFKSKFPVNSLVYRDVYLWPFLRNELMVQASFAWKKGIKYLTHFDPYLSQMCHFKNMQYENKLDYQKNFHFFDLEDIVSEKTDFLFFVNLNSVDLIPYANGFYSRIIDPIYEAATKIGSAKKIEIIKGISSGIHKRKDYINKTIPILPPHIYKSGFYKEVDISARFYRDFKKYIPYIYVDEERINNFIDWQFTMVDFYGGVLDKYSPKTIFFFPFYYFSPLVFAARRRGINAVELQHGIMSGANNLFYDNWQELPPKGYDALPSHFWVWGEPEKQRMQAVFGGGVQVTSTAVDGGSPWLEIAAASEEGHAFRRLKERVESTHFTRTVLLTMQNDSKVPKCVEELIARSKKDVLWLIRKHPKGPKVSLNRNGSNVIVSPEVDTVPISQIFSLVDFHFTESSTSVLEADYWGVYNFVYGEKGLLNYGNYIKEGKIGYLDEENIENVFSILSSSESRQRKSVLKYYTPCNMDRTIRDISGLV